jgi:hypothetical protein
MRLPRQRSATPRPADLGGSRSWRQIAAPTPPPRRTALAGLGGGPYVMCIANGAPSVAAGRIPRGSPR